MTTGASLLSSNGITRSHSIDDRTDRQIGLGGNVTLNTITVPTEVVLWRGTPSGTRTQCVNLNVGGDLAFFTVERIDGTAIRNVEVLSCGNGLYGGLGNALFSNAQSVPVRTKAVSGLLECTFLFVIPLSS